MERCEKSGTAAPPHGFWASRGWLLVLAVLAGWHGWRTLALFDAERSWTGLVDDRPILAGRHALHLYHGYLGAVGLKKRFSPSCYDPAYYAGYPKTPIFASGSRSAELFLWAGGGAYRPGAYKGGLAIGWWLLPLMLVVSARAAGLPLGSGCVAMGLGLAVLWSDFGRQRLWAGELDGLFASGLALVNVALWLRYDARPRPFIWLALAGTSWGLCCWHIGLALALVPALLGYYFCTGGRHRLNWHLGWLLALAIAVGGNWFWLGDVARHWWIWSDGLADFPPCVHGGLTSAWFEPAHQNLALGCFAAGLLGLGAFRGRQRGLAATVWAVAALTCGGLALFGNVWEPLARIDAGQLLIPALLIATLPAAHGLAGGCQLLARLIGGVRTALAFAGVLAVSGYFLATPMRLLMDRWLSEERLPMGATTDVQATVRQLQERTTAEGRVLWEEGADTDTWTPLLAVWTGRSFIGGLGAEARIDHAALRLVEGRLAGRAVGEWSDAELLDYCRRYNVCWVAARSPDSLARLRAWSAAVPIETLAAGGELFRVEREAGYFLKGRGRVHSLDGQRLILTDLEPEGGEIVLSFHHHPGMAPSTDRVRVDRLPQLDDPIALVRLHVPGPMSRLALYWNGRP